MLASPRPVLIVQTDWLDDAESIITCGITTRPARMLRSRPPLEPTSANGLHKPCEVMLDKIMAVHRVRLGHRIGALGEDDMARVRVAVMLVLGFAG